MDDALISRLAAANPAPADAVAALDLGAVERELAYEVIGDRNRVVSESRHRWVSLPRLALAGVAVALVAAAAVIVGVGGGEKQHTAYAAEAVRVAEANPRLLVTAPGWYVQSAEDFSTDFGTVRFSNGERELELNWVPASEFEDLLADRRSDSAPSFELNLVGQHAYTHAYPPRDGLQEFESLIPPTGDVSVYVRGSFASRAEYESVVTSLTSNDIDTWLAAMPSSLVDPTEQRDSVERVLQGIPLPPGFDLDQMLAGAVVTNRAQLATRTIEFVTCGWLDTGTAAQQDGDEATAQRAVDALAGAKDWPILNEPDLLGWKQDVHRYAELLASGDAKRSIYDQEMNCIEWR